MKELLYSTALLLRSHNANSTCLDDFSQDALSAAGTHILNQLIQNGDGYEASVLLCIAADNLRASACGDDFVRALAARNIRYADYMCAEVTYAFFRREGDLQTVLYELDHMAKDRVIRWVALYQYLGGAS